MRLQKINAKPKNADPKIEPIDHGGTTASDTPIARKAKRKSHPKVDKVLTVPVFTAAHSTP
jgi:hypothetical protein